MMPEFRAVDVVRRLCMDARADAGSGGLVDVGRVLDALDRAERLELLDEAPAVPAGPGDTVPNAPVEALLAVLGGMRTGVPRAVEIAEAEVRRHLDGGA